MASSIARTATLFRKLLSGRRITYRQLEAEENINRRTALRWIAEARRVFDDALKSGTGERGEKEFWLEAHGSHWMGVFKHQPPNPDEIASLDKAIKILRREGLAHEENQLTSLRGKLHGVVERRNQATRVENDVEAITDAWGIASRPGPHIRADADVTATLRDALLRQRKVGFRYRRGASKTVEPAGLLYGGAPRLVGREKAKDLAQYRLDRMSDVRVLDTANQLPEDALRNYLSTLFGSFGEAPVNVQWRFHPDAPQPEEWTFHPTQKVDKDADGFVKVSFRAGGLDDMARHVIGWWDWIQVREPKSLRKAVLRMRLAGLAQLLYEFADQRTATRIWNLAEKFGANKVEYWE